jgi:hypothetical protein
MDYFKNVKEYLPQLIKLDGTDLIQLQMGSSEDNYDLTLKGSGRTIAELARHLKDRAMLPRGGIKLFREPPTQCSSSDYITEE